MQRVLTNMRGAKALACMAAVIAVLAVCLALPQQGFAATTYTTVYTGSADWDIGEPCKVGQYYYYTRDDGTYATTSPSKKGVRLSEGKATRVSATTGSTPSVVLLAYTGNSYSKSYVLCAGVIKSAKKASINEIKTFYAGYGVSYELCQTYGQFAYVRATAYEQAGNELLRVKLADGTKKTVATKINNLMGSKGKFIYFDSEKGPQLLIFNCAKGKIVKEITQKAGGRKLYPNCFAAVGKWVYVDWTDSNGDGDGALMRYAPGGAKAKKMMTLPSDMWVAVMVGSYAYYETYERVYYGDGEDDWNWGHVYRKLNLKTLKSKAVSEKEYSNAEQYR